MSFANRSCFLICRGNSRRARRLRFLIWAVMIKPGEEIHGSGGQRLRVLDVVPFAEEDESPFVGMLKVEGLD